jgi:hypothetical protein
MIPPRPQPISEIGAVEVLELIAISLLSVVLVLIVLVYFQLRRAGNTIDEVLKVLREEGGEWGG